ncbi:MAG: InlB B-repeat-containing protein [Spirochaetaceae bacterium]|jgi:hypothetical protein|nr:InlB B-repeat-containing protein [Spirochaetaceae bacterium]
MKKAIYSILALLTIIGMVSCGGGSTTTDPGPGPGPGGEKVTITFDANLGDLEHPDLEVPAAVEINKNSSLGANMPGALDDGPDDAFYFAGWFDAATGGNVVTASTTFSTDKTVYAQWLVLGENDALITFYLNYVKSDGVIYVRKVVEKGEALGEDWPANPPARTGYTFENWNENDLGSGNIYTNATVFNADASVYAYWLETSGGGEEELPENWAQLIAGSEKVTLENGSYVVYKFTLPEGKVWSDYASATAEYLVTQKTFDERNARGVRMMGNYFPFDFTLVEYEPYPKANAPGTNTSPGGLYMFDNNGDLGGGGGSFADATNSKLAGLAPFEWYKYTYRIDGNTSPHAGYEKDGIQAPKNNETKLFMFGIGISGQNNDQNGTVSYIKNVTLVGNPTVDPVIGTPVYIQFDADGDAYPAFVGYTSTDGQYGVRATKREMVDSDTIDPSWIVPVPDVTVTFDLNYTGAATPTTKSFKQGGTLSDADLAEPTTKPSGFVFMGWFDEKEEDSGNQITTSTKFLTSKTIYAQWLDPASVAEVSYVYNYAGGPETLKNNIRKGRVDANFPDDPSRAPDYYDFVGWNTRADGKGFTYTSSSVFQRDTTLYTIWKAKVLAPANYSIDVSGAEFTVDPAPTTNYAPMFRIPITFPGGYSISAYEKLTVKVKFFKIVDSEEVEVPAAYGFGTVVFCVDPMLTTGAVYNGAGKIGDQFNNLGVDGPAVDNPNEGTVNRPLGAAVLASTNFGGIVIERGGGDFATAAITKVTITEITFHTGLAGEVAAINVDEATFTDPLFSTINNQTWNLSAGDLKITVPTGYDTYKWIVNGSVEGSGTNELTIGVASYVDKINTSFTVTAIAGKGANSYSKTIVITVKR